MASTPRAPLRPLPDRRLSSRRMGMLASCLIPLLVLAACVGAGPSPAPSCMDVLMGHTMAGAMHAGHGVGPLAADPDPTPSPPPPSPTRSWSQAAGWPGGVLPAEGDEVRIAADEVVLLDVSPPPLAGLRLDGSLVFARQDLSLRSDWIMVHGGLYVGSAAEPFMQRAEIVLTGERLPDQGCFGSKFIGMMDGVVELYGDPSGPSWTRLSSTAQAGDSLIHVDDASGWRVGDRIAVASTDYYAFAGSDGERYDRQVEVRTLTAVNGHQLTLDRALNYMHYGQDQSFGGMTLASRAEVMRLDRNVTLRGDDGTMQEDGDRYRFGGHLMAMGQSRLRLDSVEVSHMGQEGILLRYPLHFHLMGHSGHGSFIRNVSLHTLFNRCITIHGTHGVLVDASAAFDTIGHCYFLEDAVETGNLLRGNLGLLARKPSASMALLASDRHFLGPAMFWITHPDNAFIDNVAASSEGTGFWFALPEHPTGPSYAIFDGANVWPRRTPLGAFRGNLAHSNASDGLHVDNGPTLDVRGIEVAHYAPRIDPTDRDSARVEARFEDYTAYRHRQRGAWFRGDTTLMTNAMLADNAIGATFASNRSGMVGGVVVGETDNLGWVFEWEQREGQVGEDGRSLPRPWEADFAIRGFEFYDGHVWVEDVHFERFSPNGLRKASALGFLDFTAFSLSPRNHLSNLSFAPGTNEVYLATRRPEDQSPSTSDSNEDGYRSAVFLDQDGSVTGTAGAFVTVNNEFLAGQGCARDSDWNAYVCSGHHYLALTLYLEEPYNQLAPVHLRRDDPDAPFGPGPLHTMFGSPHGGSGTPNRHFRTLLRHDGSYHYQFGGGSNLPRRFTLQLQDMQEGDAMIVSLPYTGGDPPFIYRDWWIDERSRIPSVGSLSALQAFDDSAYHWDGSRLYLRMALQETNDDRDWAHLTFCRTLLCR